MILLDTNVLSALMRADRDDALDSWLDGQLPTELWTTTISVFEVELGLALLPEGRRRRRLEEAFAGLVDSDLRGRVVAFDRSAASAAARLAAARQARGRSGEWRDTQIAGIALTRGATLATRNLRHFDDLETPVIDPWAVSSL